MNKLYPVIIVLAVFLSGCTKESPATDKAEPGVADYITGAEQLKTFKKAKSKIEEVNETVKEREEEIK
jgi:PBP1b-binding outer membrane lipoprotein LpoB